MPNAVSGAQRRLAVVTGASRGIGLELARCAAEDGCDLVIAARGEEVEEAAGELRALGVAVDAVRADLATEEGVEALWERVGAREVDHLLANAGVALGHAFVEQDWARVAQVIDLNVRGTTFLLHGALQRMVRRGEGQVLVTGSIAGTAPGAFVAVYSATKAYLDSLSHALREEVGDRGVTVTCLLPGVTDTPIYGRSDMENTLMVKGPMADPADVARAGYEAMRAGRAGITPGLANKLVATFAGVLPDTLLAKVSRLAAEQPDEDEKG